MAKKFVYLSLQTKPIQTDISQDYEKNEQNEQKRISTLIYGINIILALYWPMLQRNLQRQIASKNACGEMQFFV